MALFRPDSAKAEPGLKNSILDPAFLAAWSSHKICTAPVHFFVLLKSAQNEMSPKKVNGAGFTSRKTATCSKMMGLLCNDKHEFAVK